MKKTLKLAIILPAIVILSVSISACESTPNIPVVTEINDFLLNNKTKFLPYITDIPAMQGFEVDPRTASIFDSKEGRVAQIYATGFQENHNSIEIFYDSILPRFGWTRVKRLTYIKNSEVLTIAIEKGSYLYAEIKYTVKPHI